MKILLLGKNGQVGWELQRAVAPLGDLVALDRLGGLGLCGDLGDLDGLRQTIRTVKPDVLVNAAAYTAVDKAESESELAGLINARAPQAMAEEMHKLNGWLVHYSTDYVFDGQGEQPWQEDAQTAPLNQYGHTKWQGEQAVQQSGCKHLIFRTSWVYAARGANFAKTMLRLAADRLQLKVIADQFGAPTGAELIADVTAHALRVAAGNPSVAGLYHLAAAGEVSWHGYARFVIERARLSGHQLAVSAIEAIPTSDYPTPATRPLNSRLDCQKLQSTFALHLPNWQLGVARMLEEIQGH
jgi:dTDP-4-dehydrorhamnose reductase